MNYIALEPQIKSETFHTACHCSGFGASNIWNEFHSVTYYSDLTIIQSAPEDINAQAAKCWVWEHVSCYHSPTSAIKVLPSIAIGRPRITRNFPQAIASQFTNSDTEQHFSQWAIAGWKFFLESIEEVMKTLWTHLVGDQNATNAYGMFCSFHRSKQHCQFKSQSRPHEDHVISCLLRTLNIDWQSEFILSPKWFLVCSIQ